MKAIRNFGFFQQRAQAKGGELVISWLLIAPELVNNITSVLCKVNIGFERGLYVWERNERRKEERQSLKQKGE